MWFQRNRCFIWEVSCVIMAKLAYLQEYCTVCTQHGLTKLNWEDSCFKKILNIPHSFVSTVSNKIVLERRGRQDISNVLTYRQLISFGKIAALPSTAVWRGSACFSDPSAPDCWTAGDSWVQRVRTCDWCGRGCWPWWGLVVQLETVENFGAILLFRTAPIERVCVCAMPMCHWREALKVKGEKWTVMNNEEMEVITFHPLEQLSPQQKLMNWWGSCKILRDSVPGIVSMLPQFLNVRKWKPWKVKTPRKQERGAGPATGLSSDMGQPMGHQNLNMGMHHQGREAEAKHKIRAEGAAMSGKYVQVGRSVTGSCDGKKRRSQRGGWMWKSESSRVKPVHQAQALKRNEMWTKKGIFTRN